MSSNQNNTNNQRKKFAFLLLGGIALIGIMTVFLYRHYQETHISTDDAYVTGRLHVIAAKVPGTVSSVAVDDNRFVEKGDLLLTIDESDYELSVRRAEANLRAEQSKMDELSSRIDVARKQLAEVSSRISSAQSVLRLQEVTLEQAGSDLKRARILYENKTIPEEQLEKTRTAHAVAEAQVAVAREQMKQARASWETQQSAVTEAEAALRSQEALITDKKAFLEQEQLRLDYTHVLAPVSGYITRRSVERGNQIQAGQPLMSVVPLDDVWIEANYKETQIRNIQPGQKVKIRVDAFPGRTFEGIVDSVMAGTGSVFSLFPPENATGSYVKVVQRIPVKINLKEGTDKNHVLRVGMSVIPTILAAQ
ncbi:MAG: HlyD family secretion protein [Deltaproteobacteria bacterium]|nr:HlyD family secretion protein [Deltaproteobacteria bacterium]